MSDTFTIDHKTGNNSSARIPLPSAPASTFHSDRIKKLPAAVAEANSIIEDAFDQLEWHNIVSNPRVRSGLRRLAAEARRQIAAGETEEGGFGVE